MMNNSKVVRFNGNAVGSDLLNPLRVVSRLARKESSVTWPRSRHCSVAKDLPTDVGGADVAMQSAGMDGALDAAPAAASSEDDDGGGGDSDPDGGRAHSKSPLFPLLNRSAHFFSAPLPPARLLRIKQVNERTGLSRSTIYQFIKDGKFPPSLSIGARAVAWLESDIDRWISERVHASFQRAEAA